MRAAPPPAAIREAIKGGGFDAVLFTSSSTVRNLVGIAGKPHASTVIACIGPPTAKTAEEHGLRVDVLAPTPSVAALAEALAEYGAAAARWPLSQAGEPVLRPSQKRTAAAPQGEVPEVDHAGSGPDGRRTVPGRPAAPAAPHARAARPGRRDPAAPARAGAADVRPRGARRARGRSPRCPASSSTRATRCARRSAEAAQAGVGGLMLFGVPSSKDAVGSGATDPDGILNVAIRDVVAEVGDALVVMTDLCLDEFTDHGHCGVLAADGRVDNDATLLRYAEMALAQAGGRRPRARACPG